MATPVNSNTFLSTYNDDYRDSDHYHRILFNNGRALQARELTQSQTIIQHELARLARFMFKEGAIFNNSYGALSSGANGVDFVKVVNLPTGYNLLVGNTVTNEYGLKAIVKAVVPGEGTDSAALLIKYTDGNSLTTTVPRFLGGRSRKSGSGSSLFGTNQTLSYDTGEISGTILTQATNTSTNPIIGKGCMVELPSFDTFVSGHLVFIEAQKLVVSKFDAFPDAVIGFKLTEEVITASDNIALYDNSGSTPNLTSPGADRYKITMTLAKESDIIAGESFFPVMKIVKGEARAIQSRDNVLNEMGTVLNERTNAINGSFITTELNVSNPFSLSILADSDTNYLQYQITEGTAFIGGQKITKNEKTIVRSLKPRSAADQDVRTNEFVTARYGNYFIANEDSAFGMLDTITNFTAVNLRSAVDYGGSTIGTARIRQVDKFGDTYRYHMFDVTMDSSGGTPYSIGLVRSFGQGASEFANITPIEGRYDLYDRSENSLLFPLPLGRVNTVNNVTMPVRAIYTATSSGSGQATFNTGSSSEPFTDFENWIAQVDSSSALIAPVTIVGTPANGQAVVGGLPTNSGITLLAFKSISAVRKNKTLITGATKTGSLTNRKISLSHADIYKVDSIVDDTTSADITQDFFIDNGQRDNFYTIGSCRLKPGVAAPAGTVTVTYQYFQHGAGDFFAGKASYADVLYENVPSHKTAAGQVYRLTDVIDMRPVKNNTGTGFTGTGAIIEPLPKNTATITAGTVNYWLPRVDILSMNSDGQVVVLTGRSSRELPDPSVPGDHLLLHKIVLYPYVLKENDLSSEMYPNKGYKMSDIRKLESRISNLEVVTTLNSAELKMLQTSVPDPNDATLPDRIKLGLTSDAFLTNLQSAVLEEDYRAKVYTQMQALTPHFTARDLPLYYDSDQSSYTVRKGNTIWPKYTEEVMINQSVASKPLNVNRFEVSITIGSAVLIPSLDSWTVRRKVDPSYQVESTTSLIPANTTEISSAGNTTKATG